MQTIDIITKEEISSLRFSSTEVLFTAEEVSKRAADLQRAQTLGNLLQSKVKLVFKTAVGSFCLVETTVWAVGKDFISLKGGIFIPIRAIYKVE